MQNHSQHDNYDAIIVGGAAVGSAIAYFLSVNPEFDGRILVVERDPTYSQASTALSASCIRHQFSDATNVQMSMFGSDFIRNLKDYTKNDDAPDIALKEIGYLFLAPEERAQILRNNHAVQKACGAATELLNRAQIQERYPFYRLDDIVLASFNGVGEGWFDGYGLMQYLNAEARRHGVEVVHAIVADIVRKGSKVSAVILDDGAQIGCGVLVNAAGPRASCIAKMAGISLPVEPRKRCLFLFDCKEDLGRPLPLTIDPLGVHCRSEGQYYLAGTVPKPDNAVDFNDFEVDHKEFEDEIWPIIANRIPAFETIKLIRAWAGHYAYNTLDQNAILGAHPDVPNLFFANGFSGHGLQQASAVGRGISELILFGEYRELNMTSLGFERIIQGRQSVEQAII